METKSSDQEELVLVPVLNTSSQEEQSLAARREAFNADLARYVAGINSSTPIVTTETYAQIVEALADPVSSSNAIGSEIKAAKAQRNQEACKIAAAKRSRVNRWKKTYTLLEDVLVFKEDTEDGAKVVSHTGRMFEDLVKCHDMESAHAGRHATEAKVRLKHGRSIPRHAVVLFLKNCLVCRKKGDISNRKVPQPKRIRGKNAKKEKKEDEEMSTDEGGTFLDGNEGNFEEAAV